MLEDTISNGMATSPSTMVHEPIVDDCTRRLYNR